MISCMFHEYGSLDIILLICHLKNIHISINNRETLIHICNADQHLVFYIPYHGELNA